MYRNDKPTSWKPVVSQRFSHCGYMDSVFNNSIISGIGGDGGSAAQLLQTFNPTWWWSLSPILYCLIHLFIFRMLLLLPSITVKWGFGRKSSCLGLGKDLGLGIRKTSIASALFQVFLNIHGYSMVTLLRNLWIYIFFHFPISVQLHLDTDYANSLLNLGSKSADKGIAMLP